jgi:DNA mismatch endonuclease (patch repair protein)
MKKKIAIFIHGCFWHGHECYSYRKPKTHIKFWEEKINLNRKRDLRERLKLRSIGWHVIQLWECQLKPKVQKENLNSLLYTLNHITLLNYDAKEHTLYSVEETDKITENEIETRWRN